VVLNNKGDQPVKKYRFNQKKCYLRLLFSYQ
jgi:hypothetical protein